MTTCAARRRRHAKRGRAGVPRGQLPNAFSASFRSSATVIARDDERGVAGNEVLLPERLHVLARQLLVRRLGADLAESIRMRRPYSAAAVTCADDLHRVAALLDELGQPARPHALDLFGRESRTQRDVGDERRASPGNSSAATAPKWSSRPSSCLCRAPRRSAPLRQPSAARCASACPDRASPPRSWRARACRADSHRCRFAARDSPRRPARRAARCRITVNPFGSSNDCGTGSCSGRARPGARLLVRHGSSALIDSAAAPAPPAGAGGVGTSGASFRFARDAVHDDARVRRELIAARTPARDAAVTAR